MRYSSWWKTLRKKIITIFFLFQLIFKLFWKVLFCSILWRITSANLSFIFDCPIIHKTLKYIDCSNWDLPWYNLNMVESGIKHHNPNWHLTFMQFTIMFLQKRTFQNNLKINWNSRSQFEQSIYLSVLWMIGQSNMNERLADVILHRMLF
jgi:hypothetical protein